MPMNRDTLAINPTLIMVRGIPGGGKSFVTANLRASIGDDTVIVLDPDAIDKSSEEYQSLSRSLSADGVNEVLHPYRFLRARAYQGIETNKTIIWNQGFIDLDGFNKTVINLTAYAHDHGKELPTLVVEVEIDSKVAQERIAARAARGGHNVPDDAFARFVGNYESFSDKGYTTVTVNGTDDVQSSVTTILNALTQLPQKSS
jgi:predicted ABC-type ATPase